MWMNKTMGGFLAIDRLIKFAASWFAGIYDPQLDQVSPLHFFRLATKNPLLYQMIRFHSLRSRISMEINWKIFI